MHLVNDSNKKQHDYPTYGRQFAAYRWFKPLIVAVLFAGFYMFFAAIIEIIVDVGIGLSVNPSIDTTGLTSARYEDMDVASWYGALQDLGGIAVMIPALALAALIVRDRPFSSYESARGGWSMRIYFRCLLIAFICVGIPILISTLMEGNTLVNKFSISGFILLTLLGPIQCIAEEFAFRGLLMQTFGSWVRIPALAVILQAALFALAHPYNWVGKLEIFISGLCFGLTAWLGRGIEVSSALHVANNMTIFYLVSLNLTTVATDVEPKAVLESAVMYGVYVLVIFIISRKTNWFDKIRKEDAAKANEKYIAKRLKKAAKKGKTYEPPSGIPLGNMAAEFEGGSAAAQNVYGGSDGRIVFADYGTGNATEEAGKHDSDSYAGGKHFKK